MTSIRRHFTHRLALVGLPLALLVACAAEPEPASSVTAALSPSPNDQAAFEFFVGHGLTDVQAAGIVGNLDQESQMNPGAVQSGGPGRGIAQWSVGGRWDTSSGDNATAYAAQQGMALLSLQLQLEFIWFELTTHSYGLTQLRATTNVTDATVEFMTRYEICGACAQTQRITYANAVLAAYGQIPYGAGYVSQTWPVAAMPPMTSSAAIPSRRRSC